MKTARSWKPGTFNPADRHGSAKVVELSECPTAPGPGTNLCLRFKEFGFKDDAECDCKELAKLMNVWGPEGCRKRIDSEILPRIEKNAKTRKAIYREEIVRPIVMAAIAAAEGKAPTLGQSLAIGIAKIGSALLPASVKNPPRQSQPVSVVIPCHNYGRFLAECLESAIAAGAAEILVVDDASEDETAEVAARFPVRYLRVENRNLHATRAAGFTATSAPLVCFLDADDTIAPDYLSQAVRILEAEPTVGIVYTDLFRFGSETGKTDFPAEADPRNVELQNCIHAGSVTRRTALEVADVFKVPYHHANAHEDWWMWRQLLRAGWKARKSPAVYNYRRHPAGSMLCKVQSHDWFTLSSAAEETVTVCIPLAGRLWAWELLSAWLDRQTWPHQQVELRLLDTSQDPAFAAAVTAWMARSDYQDVRHIRAEVGFQGLADAPRREFPGAVNVAVARCWQRLTRGLTTPWTLCLEDDILPPDDAIGRMMRRVGFAIDSVTAAYRTRHHADRHWHVQRKAPENVKDGDEGTGLEEADGSGFGCLLVRSHFLSDHPFGNHLGSPWYDPSFFRVADREGMTLVVDWSIVCRHYSGPEEWV